MDLVATRDGNGKTSSMAEICDRYKQLYAGLIFDVLESLGYPNQVLSHELVALAPGMKIAGPAFTVKGTLTTERDAEGRQRRMKAIRDMTYPCVEVRDRGTPFNVAIYGELSATTARAHGAVGAVIDGGTRDCGHLIKMEFPVFSRYRSPVEAFGRYSWLKCQVPVLISGELTHSVVVNPGDFMFGDEDGVISIPKDLTMKVLEQCEDIKLVEDDARRDFARGDDPVEVFEKYKRL